MQSYFGLERQVAYHGQKGRHGVTCEFYVNNTEGRSQEDTFTIVYEDGVLFSIVINAETFSYTSSAGNTETDVRDALIAAINLSVQELIPAPTSNTTFTVTGAKGTTYSVFASATGGTTGDLTVATTQAAVETTAVKLGRAIVKVAANSDNQAQLGAPDMNHRFIGISIHSSTMYNDYPIFTEQNQVHQYTAGELMTVAVSGSVFVETEEDVSPLSEVWYRYDNTGKTGVFRGSTATGCAQLTNARWMFSSKAGNPAELVFSFQ